MAVFPPTRRSRSSNGRPPSGNATGDGESLSSPPGPTGSSYISSCKRNARCPGYLWPYTRPSHHCMRTALAFQTRLSICCFIAHNGLKAKVSTRLERPLAPVYMLIILCWPVFEGLHGDRAEKVLWGAEQTFRLFYLVVEKITAVKEEKE